MNDIVGPAIVQGVFEGAIHERAVLGMHHRHKGFIVGIETGGIEFEDPIHLCRPAQIVARQIELPATQAREALRIGQTRLAL